MTRRRVVTLALAVVAFAAAVVLPRLIGLTPLGEITKEQRWFSHFLSKTILAAISCALIFVSRRPLREWGFARPSNNNVRSYAAAIVLGMLASATIVVSPARGMTWLSRDLGGFAGIVLWIWIYSSVTEELFVRGWFQSALEWGSLPPRLRVVISGLFFGAMHLSLFATDTDALTIAVIVPATTLLGFIAAATRERSGSLVPPILAHIGFNVGSALGGVLATVAIYAITGKPPLH